MLKPLDSNLTSTKLASPYTTNSFGRMIMLRTSLSFHSGQQYRVGRGKKQLPVAAEGDVDESREAEQIGQVYGPECFCARIICTVTIESASRSSEPHRRYHFGNIRVSRMALVYTRYRAWFL